MVYTNVYIYIYENQDVYSIILIVWYLNVMEEEQQYKVILDRPFGLKIAGGPFGSFVAFVEEKGNADLWNEKCRGNSFEEGRMIRPGDAFVAFLLSNGQKFVCNGKTHEQNLTTILEKLPDANITVEFRRMVGQEKIDFQDWRRKYNIPSQ
jgi:hypothetical protein